MDANKCNTCIHDFATCQPKKAVFGIDVDPSLRGFEADRVVECNLYEPIAVDKFTARKVK